MRILHRNAILERPAQCQVTFAAALLPCCSGHDALNMEEKLYFKLQAVELSFFPVLLLPLLI